ncbi:hypothetical protein F5876DRAFT_71222 [Lentinula aff. lateritia]|uniref:Uncharacterized protein n=1 Tax=Lentinula aff. lateritia TaxID=2804960 RepID=A0ACC1TGF9_9AGAR|nr:hypothetical protein F5876DRAFT_71222 [Lentinula aff. lateritia]
MLLPRESINALLKAWKYFIDDPEALIFEFLDVVNQNTLAGSTKYNFQMCYVDALTEEIQENKELPDLQLVTVCGVAPHVFNTDVWKELAILSDPRWSNLKQSYNIELMGPDTVAATYLNSTSVTKLAKELLMLFTTSQYNWYYNKIKLVKGNFGDSSDESENNEEDEEEQSEGEKEAKMLKKQGHKKQAILSASHIVVNENEINLTSLALLAMISDELQTPQSQSWLLVLLNY